MEKDKEKKINEIKILLDNSLIDLKRAREFMDKAREVSAKYEEFDEDSYDTEEAQETYNYACYNYWDLENDVIYYMTKLKDLDESEYIKYKKERYEKALENYDNKDKVIILIDSCDLSNPNCLYCDLEYKCHFDRG